MARTALENCLRLAKAAKGSNLAKAQEKIFPRMLEAVLTEAEVGLVLAELKRSTGAGIPELKKDWKTFQKGVLQDELDHAVANSGSYYVTETGISYLKPTNQGPMLISLCNFDARIVQEEVRDNGAEREVFLTLQGMHSDGTTLPEVRVPAQRFSSMAWLLESWGATAIISAGAGNQDRLREAIQRLSGQFPRTTTYAHSGWRHLNGNWVYLHAGGGIGEAGALPDIQVSFEDSRLQHYHLPSPPEGHKLTEAVVASFRLLDLADRRLTYPLLAALYRAPLGEVIKIDFALFVTGLTGTFKTELSALVQSHFGQEFNGRNLPGNWTSTENSLEMQAFCAKDTVFVIDDFCPTGGQTEVNRLHQRAERLFRGQGNQTGRGRMRKDGGLRATYYPRGIILSSGEDVPNNHSLRARILFLEIAQGSIDTTALSAAQVDAQSGLYAEAMAGFLRWLAPQMDELKKTLPQRQKDLRDVASSHHLHRRTPEQVASLMVGWELFLNFAVEVGAIAPSDKAAFWEEAWQKLGEVAAAQIVFQQQADPLQRFLNLLGAAFATGRAHLVDVDGKSPPTQAEQWGWRLKTTGSGFYTEERWEKQGEMIGWLDGNNVLLEPEATYALVQRFTAAQGGNIAMSPQTLYKRMGQNGLLASKDTDRNTTRWVVGGKRTPVIHLLSGTLFPDGVPNVPAPAPIAFNFSDDDDDGEETTSPPADNRIRFD